MPDGMPKIVLLVLEIHALEIVGAAVCAGGTLVVRLVATGDGAQLDIGMISVAKEQSATDLHEQGV